MPTEADLKEEQEVPTYREVSNLIEDITKEKLNKMKEHKRQMRMEWEEEELIEDLEEEDNKDIHPEMRKGLKIIKSNIKLRQEVLIEGEEDGDQEGEIIQDIEEILHEEDKEVMKTEFMIIDKLM